ncbi:hypothetical protein OS125_11535 [Corynebacterium sp. P7003]|uniref:Secreted protein n=1 Tax=Corynebacterium pygosceleis TaxID=2800406 RepID=A0ABT3WYE6_9CORY|nr:hypothetical protein [Corynebacterium pygosceleis]MCX7445863.1 hypothetical protein [Corynebacterium pygosceleis]
MDVGTLFTVIGGAAGVCGLTVAIWSQRCAKRANEIAQRSDQRAAEANTLSRESNSIAVDARELAEEANTFSRRAEERDTEKNDVAWAFKWVEPGTCEVTNIGQDEALGATVWLLVNGDHVSSGRRDVSPGESIVLTHPVLTDKLASRESEFLAEQRVFEERRQRWEFTGKVEIPPVKLPVKADVRVEVKWVTRLGKQRERIFEYPGSKLHF